RCPPSQSRRDRSAGAAAGSLRPRDPPTGSAGGADPGVEPGRRGYGPAMHRHPDTTAARSPVPTRLTGVLHAFAGTATAVVVAGIVAFAQPPAMVVSQPRPDGDAADGEAALICRWSATFAGSRPH